MTTFRLTSPTILYDKDEEAPEICYTEQWVLCLPIENHCTTSTPAPEAEYNEAEYIAWLQSLHGDHRLVEGEEKGKL